MAHLVLVHGAWHGPWVWTSLINELPLALKVHAVEMPGRTPDDSTQYLSISLKDYVQAIEEVIAPLEGPIYLLGHSLAGISISQVAENHPEKIAGLIYLAAFVPKHGESMFDITQTFDTPGLSSELKVDKPTNTIHIKQSDFTFNHFFNKSPKIHAKEFLNQLQPEPFKAFVTQAKLSDERFGKVKKYYIKCTEDKAITPSQQDNMAQKNDIMNPIEIESDHSPYLSNPQALCKAILTIMAE